MERKKKMSAWLLLISFSYLTTLTRAQQKDESYDSMETFLGDAPDESPPKTTLLPPGANIKRQCRTRYNRTYNESAFYWDQCAQCYSFMPDDMFRPAEKFIYWFREPGCLRSNDQELFCLHNEEDRRVINDTVKTEKGMRMWNKCCEAGERCCQHMIESNATTVEGPHCKRVWDGWACIDDAPAGLTVDVPCPSYIYFYSDPPEGCVNHGSKVCYENGTWAFKTVYETCGQAAILRRRLLVNIAAFGVSLLFLVPAVIIFMSYKQLRVPRITMHTNLFLSLIANGVVVILYKSLIGLHVLDEGSSGIVDQNSGGCKFALALTKYTRMTSYMWMFCEGFYLHKLIVAAFAEQKRLVIYYILGWVGPIFPVTLYALIRHFWADEQCWMVPYGNYEWIINAPMLLSLALNLAFLCNIIRVLITKLRAAHAQEPSQYRKAVRATVVLVPLFGLHFLLTIYLPNMGTCGTIKYTVSFIHYVSYITDGLQGFLVSVIFCYANGEVVYLLKRSYHRYRMVNDPRGHHLNSRASMNNTQVMSITEASTCGKNYIAMT